MGRIQYILFTENMREILGDMEGRYICKVVTSMGDFDISS